MEQENDRKQNNKIAERYDIIIILVLLLQLLRMKNPCAFGYYTIAIIIILVLVFMSCRLPLHNHNACAYYSTVPMLTSPLLFCRGNNHGIIHVNSRFRRDARSMEEDEETWFDQGEEENGEEATLPSEDFLENDEPEFKTRKSFISSAKTNKLSNEPPVVNNKTVSIHLLVVYMSTN